jgi:hypothetical protein
MFEVIKSYAGIPVGTIVQLPKDSIQYMIEAGYVKPIETKTEGNASKKRTSNR